MNILLVDDNSELRHTLSTLLQHVGHDVQACPNGQDAWSKLEDGTQHFELVVTDVRMPHMTGVEFASRLRACGSQTPIIFIAGGMEAELEPQQPELVPYTVVHKPFLLSTFLEAMTKISGVAS